MRTSDRIDRFLESQRLQKEAMTKYHARPYFCEDCKARFHSLCEMTNHECSTYFKDIVEGTIVDNQELLDALEKYDEV